MDGNAAEGEGSVLGYHSAVTLPQRLCSGLSGR